MTVNISYKCNLCCDTNDDVAPIYAVHYHGGHIEKLTKTNSQTSKIEEHSTTHICAECVEDIARMVNTGKVQHEEDN